MQRAFGRRSDGGDAAEQTLACDGFSIRLPAGHMLPTYQRLHPRYDRFLPHLAGWLPAGRTIVDVGANCGDTLAAMAPRCPGAHYLCIEPDPQFFAFLQGNLERMQAALPALRVQCVQALVGKALASATLEGSGGTRHARPGAGGMATRTLDAIVRELAAPAVSLLKSDVDGFDHDVLASAAGLIERDRPLLFFECDPDTDSQRAGYAAVLGELAARGYTHWTAFDNFGEVMLAYTEPAQIVQLLDYVARLDAGRSTRSIYYVDVLAAGPRDEAVARQALDAY
jgi:FkbM family methyltransferase